ncbi:killer cell lectin-like receptor subfamily B member 1B allele B isoform X1 [Columba livia]|uniref:killer cell lectin-like receptor subfamily B member 1B allele B isoform X1 n=2 Tax=Columba livia TaxID=8932 RepID=UPI0031BA67D6
MTPYFSCKMTHLGRAEQELWPGEELAEINQRSEKPQKSRFSPGWMGRVGARGTAGDPPASPAMAEEIVYADLDIRSGRCSRKVHSLPQPGTSSCPRWHRAALCAGWTGNLILGVALVAMGCSVLHQQPENPESCKNGSGNAGDGNSTLEKIRSELRKELCLPNLQEAGGCKICPGGWMASGTKCFWAADRMRSWNESRGDCASRGAELLMPGDEDELDILNRIIGKPSSYFWIGLSRPSHEKGWTWLNGSLVDWRRSRFWLRRWSGGSCAMLRGNSITSQSCSSGSHWICQKEGTQL